jgi:flagellar basal-body rod modification protein FlgD
MSQSVSSTTGTSAASTAGSTGSSTGSSTDPLASLTGNFNTFLTLLTTQLQNQDPSSPMDSNQFTTELVEFTGVAQQIDTNTSLTQLIQLAQGSTAVQATQLIGKQVDVTSTQAPLQNGSATVDFTAAAAGPVTIALTSSAGAPLYQATVNAQAGANSWTWNGQTASGATMPDGLYGVSVTTAGSGTAAAMPFSVRGTVTGVSNSGGTVQLDLGALSVGVSALSGVQN